MKDKRRKHIKTIKETLSPIIVAEKRAVIFIATLLLGVMVSSVFLPLISAYIIDKGFANNDIEQIVFYSILLFLISAFIYFCYYLCEIVRLKASNRIVLQLKTKAVDKLLNVSIDYYHNNNSASIFQKIDSDIKTIAGIFSSESIISLMQIILCIGYAVVLAYINWKLTMLLLLFIPVKFALTCFLSAKNSQVSEKLKETENSFSSWLGEMINGMREIRTYGLAKHYKKIFNTKQIAVLNNEYKVGVLNNINLNAQTIFINLITSLLYIISGFMITDGDLTIGEIVSIQTYSFTLLDFISNFLDLIYGISALLPSAERYSDFMHTETEVDSGKEKIKVDTINFNNVSFAYKNADEIISGFSERFELGKKYALTGKNGTGKTTIINLLLRFYNPTSGEICIGGNNVSNYDLHRYRSLFSVVNQNVFLFNDSIRNNICLYQEYEDQKLMQVLELLKLSDLITEKGLDFQVGDNGCLLSGGQRQKIAFARAVLSDRPFVILDEATSNIDIGWKEIIDTLFNESFKDKTVIFITHQDYDLKVDKVIELK